MFLKPTISAVIRGAAIKRRRRKEREAPGGGPMRQHGPRQRQKGTGGDVQGEVEVKVEGGGENGGGSGYDSGLNGSGGRNEDAEKVGVEVVAAAEAAAKARVDVIVKFQ